MEVMAAAVIKAFNHTTNGKWGADMLRGQGQREGINMQLGGSGQAMQMRN